MQVRGKNIATDGSCSQSSISQWSKGADEANRAVTAKKTGGFAFHTNFEAEPWWQIDFGMARLFDEIICYNRINMLADRARPLIVETSFNKVKWTILHKNTEIFGGIDGTPLKVVRARTLARYIRLRLESEKATALHLDGVEIYDWARTSNVTEPASAAFA